MKKHAPISVLLLLIVFSLNPSITNAQKGTVKIFSEVKGINVFLDETFKGNDIMTLDSVEIGTHYLKVLKNETIIFGELINVVKEGTTSILIKNDEKLGAKLLATKTDDINEYINNKLDVILSSGSQTFTKGSSTLFPGYYSYWGFSNSVSTTVATSDWKIIKGGVKEISELDFANITKDNELQNRINLQLKKESKRAGIGAIIAVPSILIATALLIDASKAAPDPNYPEWKAYTFAGAAGLGVIGFAIVMKKPYRGHYISVEAAAKKAQEYNKSLKESLGLPPNFEATK